jgi:hypothetical protein
MHW